MCIIDQCMSCKRVICIIDCLCFALSQSLLDLKDRFDHFLNNSFSNDRLFKQAISSVSCNCYGSRYGCCMGMLNVAPHLEQDSS